MNEIYTICGAGICAVFAISVIRELKRDYAVWVVLAVCVVFTVYLIPRLDDAVAFMRELSAYLENTHADHVIRALGVTYLTSCAGDICRSAGEASIAGYIEQAGRIEIILLCIPLFRELAEIALL